VSISSQFHYDYLTVMSVIKDYNIPQGTALISFTLRCIQCMVGDKCLMRPTIDVWCKKFADG